jgi:N-acetylglucosaminyldiphosphoundecaprenol N-acetyl-beta-D-mannosaminyltransferase
MTGVRGARAARLFDLDFTVASPDAVATASVEPHRGGGRLVVTANVDHVVSLQKLPEFRAAYEAAWLRLLDGAPVAALARLTGQDVARCTGAELLPAVLRAAASAGVRVLVLGLADDERAAAGAARLRDRYPGLDVSAESPRFGFEHDQEETRRLLALVAERRPTVVLLCTGSPKSELWAHAHRRELGDVTVLCLGAALDFELGERERAPTWMRRAGVEWLHRLAQDPRRLARRYLVRDVAFLPIAGRELRRARSRRRERRRRS